MSEPMNPYDDPLPQRTGMSGTAKLLLGLGLGCGLFLLLCCGGLGVGSFMMVRMFQKSLVQDPAKVLAMTAEIVDIEIPESLAPKAAMDMAIPFVGQRFLTWTAFADTAEDSTLWLGQFSAEYIKEQDLEGRFKSSLREQGQPDMEDLVVTESETLETQVNGEPAKFTISKGTSKESQDDYWQVAGQFRGKGGPALLLIRARSPQFSKDDVMKILKSMK